jgi:hypothetical protein
MCTKFRSTFVPSTLAAPLLHSPTSAPPTRNSTTTVASSSARLSNYQEPTSSAKALTSRNSLFHQPRVYCVQKRVLLQQRSVTTYQNPRVSSISRSLLHQQNRVLRQIPSSSPRSASQPQSVISQETPRSADSFFISSSFLCQQRSARQARASNITKNLLHQRKHFTLARSAESLTSAKNLHHQQPFLHYPKNHLLSRDSQDVSPTSISNRNHAR